MANYLDKWKTDFPETVNNQTRPKNGIDNSLAFNTDGFPQRITSDPVHAKLENDMAQQLFSNDQRLKDAIDSAGIKESNHEKDSNAHANGIAGNAGSATKLATARNIQTNLASTSAASFNGTTNIAPGVTGTLPVGNGGTGQTNLDNVTVGTSKKVHTTVSSGTVGELVKATMGGGDSFRIAVGGGSNNGYAEIATADAGTEPIYVRQYADAKIDGFVTPTRTATLLDANGNTSFPGKVTAPNFTGGLNGNAATATKLSTARKINITGNATGSTSFDGSGDVIISTTVNESKHATAADTLKSSAATETSAVARPVWLSWEGDNTKQTVSPNLTYTCSTKTLTATNFKGHLAGNADSATTATTATKLQAARTISLTGDITGSATFDGSSNISINTSRPYVIGETKVYNVNLSKLDTTKFYPIIFDPESIILRCEIHSPSGAGNFPYNQNIISFRLLNYGWNDAGYSFSVDTYSVYDPNEITIGCIGAGEQAGRVCVWVRGGLQYQIISNRKPVLYTKDITFTDEGTETYTVGTNYYGGTGNENVGIVFTPQQTLKSGVTSGITSAGSWHEGMAYGLFEKATKDASGNVITDTYATKTGDGASGTWGISISGNAASATNADKVDGYHASDLLRTLGGNRTPVITDIFDRAGTIDMSTMSAANKAKHKANINKASNVTQNIWNNSTGIHAYGGDTDMSGYRHGTLKLTQSYKNFDKLMILYTDDDGEWERVRTFDVYEFNYCMTNMHSFNILFANGQSWHVYGLTKHGTDSDFKPSTETILSCRSQNCGIIAIYGIKY